MLPPVDQTIQSSNPKFEKLYAELGSILLNPDGSAKLLSSNPKRRALKKDLASAQASAAKIKILRSSLCRLDFGSDHLSEELKEIIDITAIQLSHPLSDDERNLLQADVDSLLENIDVVGQSLSPSLTDVSMQLAHLVSPEENEQPTPTDALKRLEKDVPFQQQRISDAHEIVGAQRLRIATTACSILTVHRELLEAIIQVLEQTKHGSVSRGLKAQADHLAVVAESIVAKLGVTKLEKLTQTYTPDIVSALENYHLHLDDTTIRLTQRQKAAQQHLKRYEVVGPEMKEIAARYKATLQESERIKKDIARLETKSTQLQ
ncbi:MAG: hypothetical protein M1817_002636 [Caeruleum heppii]|nr:MAG: hypothetical protein M1817_002636 [Caeruleum heppii]